MVRNVLVSTAPALGNDLTGTWEDLIQPDSTNQQSPEQQRHLHGQITTTRKDRQEQEHRTE
jgi:hypothetical protein